MRLLASVVAAGGLTASMLFAPGVVSAGPPVEIGKKDNTCVLEPKADCRSVSAKWMVEHHGNLRRIDFRSGSLHGADLRNAGLKKAKFGPVKKAKSKGRQLRANPKCGKKCRGANLEFADLSDADLSDADLTEANLEWSNLSDADLSDADLTDANLQFADLMGADLIDADLTGANLCKARMPDGSVNSNC